MKKLHHGLIYWDNIVSLLISVWLVPQNNRLINLLVQLDDGIASDCEGKTVYAGLLDGNHTYEVCTNGSRGVGCVTYNWTIG